MGIREILDKFRQPQGEDDDEPKEIRDRYLESLRRERQVQVNEIEKAMLKEKIKQYKTEKMRKHLFGIGEDHNQKSYLGNVKNKKVKVLQDKINVLRAGNIMRNSSLDNRKEEFKKKRIKILP